ncbi:hypothetical protein J5N97_016029 [Dioscorea zingiberensis]|uniref:DUF4378 domain-containing protein n=1 Tax=Dioscorea zingiberensis TaxID=325984 RepID=A0A9D5CJJ2_9LILI|nr:hypothetical protein J5N97_016029 [Dioscorea zingiberensis]
MAPLTARQISGESNLEHELEKQMGCMAGFLQLFDRPQILSAKRLYSPKRLPAAGSTSPSEQSDASVVSYARESSPEQYPSSPVETPGRPVTPLPLPVFDFKEGLRTSWKLREAPRLSLDSRAVVDAKGKLRPRDIRTTPATNAADEDNDRQRRSPSVIVRLMGLETLPGGEPAKNAELRRSSSESRVPRDLSHWGVFHTDPSNAPEEMYRSRAPDLGEYRKPDAIPRNAIPSIQKKSFFEARDYFPEPKSGGCGSLYGEIEKRLRMRGIDEPAKDLETLKQILEALQLKGLLHTKPSAQPINGRCNVIYDPRIPRAAGESPIISAKPISRPPAGRRPGSISPPIAPRSGSTRRNFPPEPTPPVRARRDRSPRSPDHGSPSPPARRRPTNADLEKKTQQQRRIPAAHSPRPNPKRPVHDPRAVASPRNRRGTPPEISHKERLYSTAEDDTSTVSSFSSSSHFDFERTRTEEYKAGRSLLERCDKLLHSIAAITSSAEQVSALDPQPSPVSVLDSSSFLGDESSPSPVLKRSLDFKEQLTEWEDTEWNQAIATVRSELGDVLEIEDQDFVYVTEIIRASDQHQDSDVYLMLEKRRSEFDDGDEGRLHRRVLFDTVAEILDRKKHASALEPISRSRSAAVLRHVWVELRRLKAEPQSDDLNDATCRVIRNDMAGDHLWGDASVEISDQVLQIERLLFKDLIADTIRDLGDLAARSRRAPALAPRRKLVF